MPHPRHSTSGVAIAWVGLISPLYGDAYEITGLGERYLDGEVNAANTSCGAVDSGPVASLIIRHHHERHHGLAAPNRDSGRSRLHPGTPRRDCR